MPQYPQHPLHLDPRLRLYIFFLSSDFKLNASYFLSLLNEFYYPTTLLDPSRVSRLGWKGGGGADPRILYVAWSARSEVGGVGGEWE